MTLGVRNMQIQPDNIGVQLSGLLLRLCVIVGHDDVLDLRLGCQHLAQG